METIVRLVEALGTVEPARINNAVLVSAACLTRELDEVYFPFNKRSTRQEPFTWAHELQRQNVPSAVLGSMRRFAVDQHSGTSRAKKAVACLLWMMDRPLAEMERIMTQHGPPGGAAGSIRAVSSRARDVLPVVVRVAEILHPGLDLAERRARLMARLEIGLPADAADLAVHLGGRLTRGDYLRLLGAGLGTVDAVEDATDDTLLECLGDDDRKLSDLRAAVRALRTTEGEAVPQDPILPPPED